MGSTRGAAGEQRERRGSRGGAKRRQLGLINEFPGDNGGISSAGVENFSARIENLTSAQILDFAAYAEHKSAYARDKVIK